MHTRTRCLRLTSASPLSAEQQPCLSPRSRTQKNKATEYHLGQLKAKLAKLRTQASPRAPRSAPGGCMVACAPSLGPSRRRAPRRSFWSRRQAV